ncbi:MAG: S66 peptidase family protein [Verrucomicrobiota bacterium]
MRKPSPLRRGDVIAVCAPAGPVDAARLRRGIARLSAAGYVPEIAEGVLAAERYFAGDDGHRAEQLAWALTLPEARAVMAARGGYGSTRLLPRIDWKKAMRRPKLLVGFSDLTAVLAYLSTRLRVPCLHGPMAAADLASRFDAEALDAFARLAAGGVSPREPWGEPMERVRGGSAEGVLTGGCLSVITSLLSTPYEPDFRRSLLFLEDVAEPAYRVDRLLTQWIQSGKWSRITGLLVGKMTPVRGETGDDLRGLFHEAGKRLSVPVWFGFPAGHVGRNVAVPFGVRARVDARGRLFLLESPVEGP